MRRLGRILFEYGVLALNSGFSGECMIILVVVGNSVGVLAGLEVCFSNPRMIFLFSFHVRLLQERINYSLTSREQVDYTMNDPYCLCALFERLW